MIYLQMTKTCKKLQLFFGQICAKYRDSRFKIQIELLGSPAQDSRFKIQDSNRTSWIPCPGFKIQIQIGLLGSPAGILNLESWAGGRRGSA